MISALSHYVRAPLTPPTRASPRRVQALRVLSNATQAVAKSADEDYYTRAANDDGIKGGPGTRTKYGYDALDRLSSGISGAATHGWSYDGNGNRLAETGTAASTYTVSSTSNRLNGTTGALNRVYSYDAAGNVLNDGAATTTYDPRGRLATLTQGGSTSTYTYNAIGERIARSGGAPGTVLFWYDEAGHLLGEYDGSGDLIQETVWLGDIPVATLRPGSPVAIYYVHTDHLNTPRQVTRPSDNAQMWTWFSDPFGASAPNENPAGAGVFKYHLRFPGQYFDAESGRHYNYFRDYDAVTGRYIQSDPIGLAGGINTYGYVAGNPTSLIDPTGLDWIEYRGQSLSWYAGEPGNRATEVFPKCAATSGLLGFQEPRFADRRDVGPVPQGWYSIDLRPDPWRQATVGPTGELNSNVGIQRIPRRGPDGLPLTVIPRAWGTWRARLEPLQPSGRNNFYLHDSQKGETHGCVETCSELFQQLFQYRMIADSIRVHVDYTGATSTRGPTRR